jgi:hypothetical protein
MHHFVMKAGFFAVCIMLSIPGMSQAGSNSIFNDTSLYFIDTSSNAGFSINADDLVLAEKLLRKAVAGYQLKQEKLLFQVDAEIGRYP